MSTYCRITGKSRGLPKPNYFPLLPPISPADAKRLCRITGKSYGLPTHHYIPVLVGFAKRHKRVQCQTTSKVDGQEEVHHTLPVGIKHTILKDFRYLLPILETHSDLLQMLEKKTLNNDEKYVYTVKERRCSLVFPGKLEAAVRDGDVRDIMLAKHTDTLLLRLRKGGSVEIDMRDMCVDGAQLYEGEGPTKELLGKKKKRPHYDDNEWRRKIFEDKEKRADSEVDRILEIKSKRIKVKLDADREAPKLGSWKNVCAEVLQVPTDVGFETSILDSFTKHSLENFVNVAGAPMISSLPRAVKIESEHVDLSHSVPGIIQQPTAIGESVVGLPVTAIIIPFRPFVARLDLVVEDVLKRLNSDKFELKKLLQIQNAVQERHAKTLPLIGDIQSVVRGIAKLMESGKYEKNKSELGLKVVVAGVEKHVAGQFVETSSGEMFIPGNVIETSVGPTFVPGLAVQTTAGTKFLPGCIFKDHDGSSVFIAGQMAVTRDGERFVQGQTVHTKEGLRFIPGQTVYTDVGMKFVPGQMVDDRKSENGFRFVPGQTVMTQEGAQFVPGQLIDTGLGEISFCAGQSFLNENSNWEFVQGQNIKTEDGGYVFIPGKEIVNEVGHRQFIPGRTVIEEGLVQRFVPISQATVQNDDVQLNNSFPGVIQQPAAMGEKIVGFPVATLVEPPQPFIAQIDRIIYTALQRMNADKPVLRQILEKQEALQEKHASLLPLVNDISIAVKSISKLTKNGRIDEKYKSEQGLKVIINGAEKYVPGQFLQTSAGEIFVPGNVQETPNGPLFVPGFAVHTAEGRKFLPGCIVMDDEGQPTFAAGQVTVTREGEKFVQGQLVSVDNKTQFIPGQTVFTPDGVKFVPGQIVADCKHRNGVRFVPGQTVTTESGPKFMPGQFTQTSVGDTSFVAGISICTENGNWEFVQGKSLKTEQGDDIFVPGKVVTETIKVENFVPMVTGIERNGNLHLELSQCYPGVIQQPQIVDESTIGLPIASTNELPTPFIAEMHPIIENAFKKIGNNKSALAQVLDKQSSLHESHANTLLRVEDVAIVAENIAKIIDSGKCDRKNKTELGLKVTVGRAEVDIPGQFVQTHNGEIFIPGKVIETAAGPSFIPGFVVKTNSGTRFLPGSFVINNGSTTFAPGQMVVTKDGEKFIQGQMIRTDEGLKFVPGQALLTTDGLQFIPGQIIEDGETENGLRFVPGQTATIANTAQFVPGKFIENSAGDISFVTGMSLLDENGCWEFVQGRNFATKEGRSMFVPGLEMVNEAGERQFVPGRIVVEKGAPDRFVPVLPSITETDLKLDLSRCSPGLIQQPMVNSNNLVGFRVTAVTQSPEPFIARVDKVTNAALKKLNADKLFLKEILQKQSMVQEKQAKILPLVDDVLMAAESIALLTKQGKIDKKHKCEQGVKIMVGDVEKFISGQFLQTSTGEVFVPGEVMETTSGPSFIPGFVVQTSTGPKFLPGHVVKDDIGAPTFVAGQLTQTQDGEKFVQGQMLRTKEGIQFVPGQTICTSTGIRFVPGQVIEDASSKTGTRFVPGHTIVTAAGPEFIRGQFVENSFGEISFVAGLSVPKITALELDLNCSLPGLIQQPKVMGNDIVGFQIATCTQPPKPLIACVDEDTTKALKNLNNNKPALKQILQKQSTIRGKHATALPVIDDIPTTVKNIAQLMRHGKIDKKHKHEQGLKIVIGDVEKFIPGQFLQTSSGEVFVPGEVVETSSGPSFVPGFAVQTAEGMKFLPGSIVKDNDGVDTFVAGQIMQTQDGEKFVQGQAVHTVDGVQFLPGQTIFNAEGIQFIPGQVVNDGATFVPGRTIMTEVGPKFVPGQFNKNSFGEASFVEGVSLPNEKGVWEFVQGRSLTTANGSLTFVPGQEIVNNAGEVQFVPGKTVVQEAKIERFVPEICSIHKNCDLNFDIGRALPGAIQQPTIIEGNIGFPVTSVIEPPSPIIAQLDASTNRALKLLNTNKLMLNKMLKNQSVVEAQPHVLPHLEEISAAAYSISKIMESGECNQKHKLEYGMKVLIGQVEKQIPGQYVQTSSGEVFIPGKVIETSTGPLFVPGFVVTTNVGTRFLPGCVIKNIDGSSTFIPGQITSTQNGEVFVQGQTIHTKEGAQFVPGQTLPTAEGVKFIPGQLIEDTKSKTGFSFVPGQMVTTGEGTQFMPGKFVETSTGVTAFVAGMSVINKTGNWEFIEGQNLKTETGSYVFVPGREILNEVGRHKFVPGKVVVEEGKVERFVPGITINSENGNLKFVPGMEVETADGLKFVEGVVIEHENTFKFSAGKVSTDDNDLVKFSNAKSKDEVAFHDIHSNFGICLNSVTVAEGEGTEVFGHLVQSSQGVEFFPGDAVGLPAGKVIPGRLVKGKETRFIPGTMIDNKFIPGQFVTSDKYEKFIPGQVIETNEGPKFVLGQVLHTRSGPKFVPGQTMETENGPKFIPGQIIETKSGPTFIPGQVIYTEEEGSRFVPGQVVDTIEGARFVPGRVVETGDHVTFIPGQIVETEDGLKFVAPDLEDDPDGGCQFTLQGFEVAQEELNMIQRNSIPYTCFIGEMAIDSKTLQQLADAGMAVGRQTAVDVPAVNIKSLPVTETACRVAEKLNIDPSYSIKMSHILSNLQQIKQSNVTLLDSEIKDENLRTLLDLVSECENDKESSEFLQMLGDALENAIKMDLDHKLQTINTLHALTTDLASQVCDKQPSKILLLKNIIKRNQNEPKEDIVERLSAILNEDEKEVRVAFQHMSAENPDFVDKVLQNAAEMLKDVSGDEKKAVDTLHRAIVKAVAETSEQKVQQMLEKTGSDDFRSLVVDAIGLAKALGLSEVVVMLHNIMRDGNSMQLLAKDKVVIEVLKRLTVMRQLARKRPNFGGALHDLQADPYVARNDPRLRELVRESAMLMVIPEETLVRSSEDIPCSLLLGDNNLAVEDFMAKTRQCGKTFLILKKGMQAVVPRDAARDVLTGKVPYTVLDENGISYFTPLHVFNALKLPRFATNRFSNYGYSPRMPKNHRSSIGSYCGLDDLSKNLLNGSCSSQEVMEEEFVLVKDFTADNNFYLDKGEKVKVL